MLTFVLLVIGSILVLAAVFWLVRLLMVLAGLLGISAIVGLVVALASVGNSNTDPVHIGMVVAALTFVLLALGRRVARKQASRRIVSVARTATPKSFGAQAPQTAPIRPLTGPVQEPTTGPWHAARRLVPGSQARIERAEAACEAVLSASEADPHDLHLLDEAALIRNTLPKLVAKAQALCAADPARRADYQNEFVAALEQLGAAAPQVECNRRRRLIDEFRTLVNHIANRSGRGQAT